MRFMSCRESLRAPTVALTLVALAGCSAPTDLEVLDIRDSVPLATKPEGVLIERGRKKRLGPPPPGYIKVVGHPMPGWDPEAMEPRAQPMSWTFLGPRPISGEGWSNNGNASGRVISIAPHPTDANTCYIAAASGGVWKTTNGGTTWLPMTDELSVINSGFVALDPTTPTTVYYGTGEYQQGSMGDGIFRSTDAGVTWTRIATAAQIGNQCTGIIVDPTNPLIIHAVGAAGYIRSTDGGTTWSNRLGGVMTGLEIHPTTPATLYVARESAGVYRSTDGGNTLSLLAGGLPASGFGRVVMDISKSSPTTLYAAFLSGGSSIGLYKTTNGGTSWSIVSAAGNFCSPQCWYDAYVAIDPANVNNVFLGGVDPRYATAGILRSTNGGTSFSEISNSIHPDHHVMVWGPGPTLWEGNDGGVWKSTNNGTNWTNTNATLGISQLYDVAVDTGNPDRVLGGTQDNGTPERTGASTNWPQLQAGDGGFSAFDEATATRRYTTYVYADTYRWNGTTDTLINGGWGSDSTNWISPLVMDPNNTLQLLMGTNRVWRTTNASAATPTWTAISTTTVGGGGTLNAIAIAEGASNTIYTGSSTGRVYHTTNASTWTNRSTGIPGGSSVSDVLVDPDNSAHVYVSLYNSSGGRIYRSTNSGVSWTSKTGTLPSGVSVQALEVDFSTIPPHLFVGSGAGVYVSTDDGATWTKDGSDFPNANVSDLHIDRPTRTITAATYGRGAWRSPLPGCAADLNNDGFVDAIDYDIFITAWLVADLAADYNNDGFTDAIDYDNFITDWLVNC